MSITGTGESRGRCITYFVDALQNGAIYEMYFAVLYAIGMCREWLERGDFRHDFCGVGESGETELSSDREFFRRLTKENNSNDIMKFNAQKQTYSNARDKTIGIWADVARDLRRGDRGADD